jgi:hypothetical protein
MLEAQVANRNLPCLAYLSDMHFGWLAALIAEFFECLSIHCVHASHHTRGGVGTERRIGFHSPTLRSTIGEWTADLGHIQFQRSQNWDARSLRSWESRSSGSMQ